ncbi:hypothetical protein FC19_GL001082 [Liquorilactobacillus aquaticus DSM 21051]|uniref:Bacteriocin immunity protein n=1 Tax=Liquorilactobacillus aquaticus DSM 21051 TaxID=1423725 RepID=A0A0R2CWN6_9LACO|nr:bacteriocin immunity protein [Liquorilactobacillus aquaticus]KRM96016.1 hypothetical protein FC19_GL001082 [Liquorilactobacillus aquaticus DSM 21051]
MKNRILIWEELDELISDNSLKNAERELFINARNNLNKGKNEQFVAAHLKSQLSFLSFKTPLSAKAVSFFTELSQVYLGYGRRDNISF